MAGSMDGWERHTPLFGDPADDGERNIVGCSADVVHPGPDEDGRAWFAQHLDNLGAPDYMVEYWRFWSSIVEPTNTGVSRDQVARELFDYRVVMDGASKVYEELAGLSKPNTDPGWILDGAERRYNEIHADLILCDLLPQFEDDATRQAVIDTRKPCTRARGSSISRRRWRGNRSAPHGPRRAESMAADTVTPEPCTTWSRRLRHFSVDLHPDKHAPRSPGRTGRTLCGEGAFDQERRQYELSRWSDRKVNVDALPPCKKCVRKAGIPTQETEG